MDTNQNPTISLESPSQTAQSSKIIYLKILALAIIVAIPLISITTVVILSKKQVTKTQKAENLSKTTNSQDFNPPIVAAFKKSLDSSTSAIMIYDFSTKSSTNLTSSVIIEKDAESSIGPWSPDGKYLPIQFHRSLMDNKPLPFYFYDLKNNKGIKLFDNVEAEPQLKNLDLSFWYSSNWLTNTTLIYSSKTENTKDKKIITVNDQGIIEEKTRPNETVMQNDRLKVIYSYNPPPPKIEIEKVYVDNKELSFKPQYTIIDVIDNMLITLEETQKEAMISQFDEKGNFADPVLQKTLESAKTEEEQKKIINSLFQPKGNSNLHLYDINTGNITSSIPLTENEWITTEALIRPKKDTVIVLQRNTLLPDFTARYLEVNPKTLAKTVISEEEGTTSEVGIFAVTSDGNWIIGHQPSKEKIENYPDLGKKISAWNIETKEKIVLCESNCYSFKVYNPYKLQLN